MRDNEFRNRETIVNSRKLMAAAILTLIASLVTPARAQTYPDHPVRLIIPFAPGGSIDTLGRILTDKLPTLWRQSVFIENRAGSGGTVGSSGSSRSVGIAPAASPSCASGSTTSEVNVGFAGDWQAVIFRFLMIGINQRLELIL
jgi:hypothetical protein